MKPDKIVAFLIGAMAVAGTILAFRFIGTPAHSRMIALDERRERDLESMAVDLRDRYRDAVLPAHVPETVEKDDPATNRPYDFLRLSSTRYLLCARFEAPSESDDNSNWHHGAGRTCYRLDLRNSALDPQVVAFPVTEQHQILRIERFGNANAQSVIFIPGAACGPWVWSRQIQALKSRYNVFVVTLPGFDGRPMISGGHLMKRALDSLHDLIVADRLQRPIIVGHSLGGTIAVMFGETYTNDAKSIVAVEGGYPAGPTEAARDASVEQSIAPYKGISQQEVAQALRTNMLQYTITKKADVDRVTKLAGRSSPAGITEWIKAALSLDLTKKLSNIRVPFTEIIPYDSQIDPYQGFKTAHDKRAAYERWVNHTQRGNVILITGSRHFVMIDRPDAFESALESAI